MIHRKPFRLLCFISLTLLSIANSAFSQFQFWNPSHAIGPVSGNTHYTYNQTPDQLVEIYIAGFPSVGQTYQWWSNTTPNDAGFSMIAGATQSSYTPGPLTQNMWFKRQTTNINGASIFSNVVKLTVVSANWEDRNYVREHDVQVTGVTTWQTVDQLPIGQKIQTTSYVDGLGRSVEKISRETATPATPGGLWGDVVQFSQYDQFGRESQKYLPYTTSTEIGKYKSAPLTEQPQYYTNVYNETAAYASIQFDKSPLNRIETMNGSGAAWSNATGRTAVYDMNSAADNVQIFTVDYIQGNPPVNRGAYAANALYKAIGTDENGKSIITYTDMSGYLILKKTQSDDAPSAAHTGWICTYSIYDDKGLLRYELQPEAVKYLDSHGWSFAGTDGAQVLKELCFQYNYDDKGRMIWKKVPGADPLNLLYDVRDRLVFTQDGNQAALSTPQWTANLYDELDRPVATVLYNTTKTVTQLQADINNSVNTSLAVTTNAQGYSINTSTFNNPVSNSDLNNTAVTAIVKYQFYDDYSFATATQFNTGFTNLSAYNTSDPNVLPIVTSKRTLSLPTGSMARVLGSGTFLSTTNYFDEDGLLIQTLNDNIKTGTDITTRQYNFDGRIMSICSDHTTTGTGFSHFITLTKNNFDKLGRVTSIQKQFGSNTFKTVAAYEYDDVGRIKTTNFDPDYVPVNGRTGNGLESLAYSFNIHNEITGINKDFALKDPANYNKWEHFFGMYLGYDNRDNVFTKSQLNGQVTGVLWNTQGDDAQRKYDYSYDNARRLINAAFTEQKHPGDGWGNAKMDFSVTGTNGKITYDLNGNLLNMLQKGVMPGTATPITIDELSYTYASYSNKLQSVTDQMLTTNVNGLSGDFKDGSNGTGADYVYDNNGNVVIDLNKNAKELENVANANGISYNFLDKPEKIRIAGKGTIRIVYSADGQKLQRVYIPESGDPATITTYINQFVYQETGSVTTTAAPPFATSGGTLSYINFEEGRIRAITPTASSTDGGLDAMAVSGNITLPDGRMGAYDYFVKDYQQSVRMILTEETHSAYNTCTMETSRSMAEDPVFGQTGGANEVESTRCPKPAAWQNANLGNSVSRLGNNAGHNIGPNTLQKVMAGDKVNASVYYYYEASTGGTSPNMVSTVLTSLAQAITGGGVASSIVKANATGITNQLNGTSGFINAVQPAGGVGTAPQAYLTVLFFDERFNFIEAADGGVVHQQVGASGSDPAPIGLGTVKAPKNGYAFVYVSNQNDQDVFFDNLKVGITRGNIIEENHYYAYGLRIAAISSRKAGDVNEGKLKNDYLYNDKELFDDADLGWYDYGFRNYDAQVGRFTQLDPLAYNYPYLTPFQYASCDPVTNIDIDGLEGGSAVVGLAGDFLESTKGINQAAVFVTAVRAVKTVETATSLGSLALNVTSIAIQTAITTVRLIDGDNATMPVGSSESSNTRMGSGPSLSNSGGNDAHEGPGDELNDNNLFDPKPKFPSFQTLLSNYPLPYDIRPDRTPIDPKKPVNDVTGENFLYFNQCAIRVSIALRKSGVSLKGAKNYTNPGSSPLGNGNIIGAKNLTRFLLKFGKPEEYNGMTTNVVSKITGRTGIIYFENIYEGGVRSPDHVHIELWDNDHYQSNFDPMQMFSGTKILFWEIK
ncbi:T6SS effector amidase Tae4 family protein [Niastella yeongjuensis]|nr:T6SS effector amidase Tae4 family protein [Niastella yeongjuensis]SEN99478.1 RHS repeat-associated core domain-containing protein [Niastella yeongjuensis]